MTLAEIWAAISDRAAPQPPETSTVTGAAVLVLAVLLVTVPMLWRLVRPGVTVVHELGHAIVGMLAGRRFTGFVVRGDMSGQAVTVGPQRGIGRVLCTAAGYPAPALSGAAFVLVSGSRWAPTTLTLVLAALAVSLLFARSVRTVLVLLMLLLALGAAWWLGGAGTAALVLLGGGALLLLGSWRHLGAVIASPRAIDDPQVLGRLTALPAGGWAVLFVVVHLVASWLAGQTLTDRFL